MRILMQEHAPGSSRRHATLAVRAILRFQKRDEHAGGAHSPEGGGPCVTAEEKTGD